MFGTGLVAARKYTFDDVPVLSFTPEEFGSMSATACAVKVYLSQMYLPGKDRGDIGWTQLLFLSSLWHTCTSHSDHLYQAFSAIDRGPFSVLST